METSAAPTDAAAARESPRAALARLVLDAATSQPDVLRGYAGEAGVWVTSHPDRPLTGVVAVARPDGRYDLELHLVARPVPLHPLSDQVRRRVAEAAAEAGHAERLGPLLIAFEDVEPAPRAVAHPPNPGLAAR